MQTMQCTVSGRVQGVAFRAATRRAALALGLSGWVRNAADGTVEVCARGPEAALGRLRAWLEAGPPAAKVASVCCRTLDTAPDGDGFEIRY